MKYLLLISTLAVCFMAQSVVAQKAVPVVVPQTPPAGTELNNRATITFDDPDGVTITGVSNTVTLVVDPVAGLAITPDDATRDVVTSDPSPFLLPFTVTNGSNFNAPVTFGPNGASVSVSCTGGAASTITRAVLDVDNSGTITPGDIDIFTNGSTVTYTLPIGTTSPLVVLVEATVSSEGGQCTYNLGDATANEPTNDNVPTDGSEGSVATNLTDPTVPLNGNVEAAGSYIVTFLKVGVVLNGPVNSPDAVGGDTTTATDYSSRSTTVGQVVECGQGTTTDALVLFQNTIRNGGDLTEFFSVQLASLPAGFTAEFSLDGVTFTPASTTTPTLLGQIEPGATLTYFVRVTVPAGTPAGAMYPVEIDAFSQRALTSSAECQKGQPCGGGDPSLTAITGTNRTTDRVYTGYVCAVKSQTIINNTGTGAPDEAVPGAEIEYTITATNIAQTPAGSGNIDMIAQPLVITEDGNLAPNNWGSTTTQVVGSASSSNGGTITGDVAGSNLLVDTVTTLNPGQVEVFKFRRKIN